MPITISSVDDAPAASLAATAVVFPAYNEERHIARSIEAALAVGVGLVVVVDDASRDRTGAIIDAYPERERLVALHHEQNKGKEGAVLTGLRRALEAPWVEAVAVLDSDMQVDPAILPKVRGALEGHEAVFGFRRFDRSMPPQRVLANSLASLAYRRLAGIAVSDPQNGLRMYGRELARVLAESLGGSARYALEHTSIRAIALHGIRRGKPIQARELLVECSYEEAESGIRPVDLVHLIASTIGNAASIGRERRRAARHARA